MMPVSLEHGRLAVPRNFIESDRDQELVIDAVAEMDLEPSNAAYRRDG